ncbi:unnamed protein product [Leptosia nina]|uniref:BED-type domain-containing protein n=1 Tax=Leptosia nina TaxID=320188 RepID=A0AAV1JAD1_9NEOP
MKRTPSIVWRFFDRIEQDNRVVAIVCKLCDNQYKYFGNTTNLRAHLTHKHPIQWELGQNESLEEGLRIAGTDDDTNQSSLLRQRRYKKSRKNDNVCYSISVDKNPANGGEEGGMPTIKVDMLEVDTEGEHDEETINLVKQMHGGSDEEWLNEDVFETVEAYQPQKKRRMSYKSIKREVTSPQPLTTSYSRPTPTTKRVIINNRRDEYQTFGEYVGNKLRKFKNNETRSNVQQLITTILWQAEYGVYNNMETIKRVLLHSVQEMNTQQDINMEKTEDTTGSIEETHVETIISE